MNVNKLKGRMVEAGYTQRTLAIAAKMSENTLSSKLNERRPFNTDEVLVICDLLHITDPAEKAQIFLSEPSY
jgi:transcriptional regulator with XRE-family HTH domain